MSRTCLWMEFSLLKMMVYTFCHFQRQTARAYVPNKPNSNRNGQTNMPCNGAPQKPVSWGCRGPGHKYQECPRHIRPSAGVCSICSCYHPTNVPCNQRASGVYASVTLNNAHHQWRSDSRGRYNVLLLFLCELFTIFGTGTTVLSLTVLTPC